mgnify:CR=1 FL=1
MRAVRINNMSWKIFGAMHRIFTVVLLLVSIISVQADDWEVAGSPVRFTFDLDRAPSHREAGYLARIPDGGILPVPCRTRVVAEDGTPVDSYTLWHGAEAGLWMVFAAPEKGKKVNVYVSTESPQLWKPETGLRPSPLLVTDPSKGDLATAKKMAGMGSVGPRVHVVPKAGIQAAPLSVGGDESGRSRPTSFYLQTYVVTTDPGKTWIAPVFNEGKNTVLLNGKTLSPSKQSDRWGGTGQWVDLEKGLHRLEVFTASDSSGQPYSAKTFRGHVYLAWKTPEMPASQLGGVRAPDQSDPGTSVWAARIIKADEIVRSGKTRLTEAVSRDGKPLAILTIEPGVNFWFEGEDQLAVYTFKAWQQGNPDDTTYTWAFEKDARMTGSSVAWLVPGQREHQVTLTATSPRGQSSSTVPFFAYPTASANLNNASDRRAFRLAMHNVLAAYPVQPDPCIAWSDAYWNNLMRTMEYGKGYPVLENLLGKRRRTAVQKLSPDDLRLLEDIFLDVTPRVDPNKALEWVKVFYKTSPLAARQAELSMVEAEIRMIYLGELEAAENILNKVIQQGGEEGERARIRLGDLYLKRGEINKAAERYAEVQNNVRHQRNGTPRPGERAVDSWKLGAVKDAARSMQVASLIESGEHLKARQALDQWERNFPLSKIGEDFILQEARLYMALGDMKRARWLLEPYCRQIEASSYLPDFAMALLRCMEEMNESQETMKEIAVLLKDRLEFHPVAEKLDYFIRKDNPPK